MAKKCYVLELPLKVEKYQADILNKRFEIARNIYNGLLNVTQKRYKEMVKTKKYKKLMSSLTGNKKTDKEIWKQIDEMRREYGFSKFDFFKDVQPMQKHFKENIDSKTARSIATNLWVAYEKLFYGNGHKLSFKRYGDINTLSGQTNDAGIKYRDEKILWNGLELPVIIDKKNSYEVLSFENKILYNTIVRKFIRGRYKYYVQILFEGIPPVKVNKSTGEIKRKLGTGKVGLDIGTSTLAVSSESLVKLTELADKVQNIENEKRKLLRKMDRSRRATNPDNFNEDGTIKKQGSKKVIWVKSNHYKKYQNELKELQRKQAAVRKYQHECLANEVLALGDEFYVETMRFKSLQSRAKKTEKNENGKFKKKKRFGKSLANHAPSMFLSILDRKLGYYDKKLVKINTEKAKASQYNHESNDYNKKELNDRWNYFDNDVKVQRDLYSAFLIQHINADLSSFNRDELIRDFNHFCLLHNNEINRLKSCDSKKLSCMGIK